MSDASSAGDDGKAVEDAAEADLQQTDDPAASLSPAAQENIDRLTRFEREEDESISPFRNAIEVISAFFGSPAYFAFVGAFVVLWIAVNEYGEHAAWAHVDKAPFYLLQGLVSFNALLLTVAVLIRQNRMAQLAEHRAHLDLQINLLTEQKVSKILKVVDELRRSREPDAEHHDPEADELTKPTDPGAILSAIKRTSDER